jgi:hypothetical protein
MFFCRQCIEHGRPHFPVARRPPYLPFLVATVALGRTSTLLLVTALHNWCALSTQVS